jgi:hypothetical protein
VNAFLAQTDPSQQPCLNALTLTPEIPLVRTLVNPAASARLPMTPRLPL